MPKHVFSYDDIYIAVRDGSRFASQVEFIEDLIHSFIEDVWSGYFDTSFYDNMSLVEEAIVEVKPELRIDNWETLSKQLGRAFDSWMRQGKDRINLSVGADIPYLLTELAGGERMRGEYVSQLIREVFQNKEDVAPSIQALRLEVMGLDGRLRTLERQVDALSRR